MSSHEHAYKHHVFDRHAASISSDFYNNSHLAFNVSSRKTVKTQAFIKTAKSDSESELICGKALNRILYV